MQLPHNILAKPGLLTRDNEEVEITQFSFQAQAITQDLSAFPAELLLLQVLLQNQLPLTKPSPSGLPGQIEQSFPCAFSPPPLYFCSVIPTFPEASTFQIFPSCPTADLCVLGCSGHEIPALRAAAGAWNVFLYSTVWFVASLNVMIQFSANATVG